MWHYANYLYDAVFLYALALNKTLSNGKDPRDGTAVFHNLKQTSFESKSVISELIIMKYFSLLFAYVIYTVSSMVYKTRS